MESKLTELRKILASLYKKSESEESKKSTEDKDLVDKEDKILQEVCGNDEL